MAFDPVQEDSLRLTLEAMRRAHIHPLSDPRFAEQCLDTYQEDPARLIVHDRDRSFHLVALATETLDYRIPFIPDDADVERLAAAAEHQLREACELDPNNWDARRMCAALTAESNDAYVAYLLDHRAEVERALHEAEASARDIYDREFMRDLGRRPYLRWLAAIASRALIAGQYRLALRTAEEALALDPEDLGGARHTAVLAMAKLECTADDLKTFHARHAASYLPPQAMRRRHHLDEKTPDAWTLIAQVAVAYHALDLAGASRALRTLMRTYPHAAEPLYFQAEFPDGIFARVNVVPGSEDELILALSEATPLLQEGYGAPDNACLASWIALHDAVQEALDQRRAAAPSRSLRPRGGEN